MYRIVEFPSQGAILRGRLYVRPNAVKPAPLVIMAHGFSATITMVSDQYAEVFHQAGLAVLLYDHRNFGASGGEPRQQINRWIQARGYRDAVDFASSLPEIDPARIALWGDSSSGGEVILAGAIDARLKAIVVQVPVCGEVLPRPDPDGAQFAAIRETFLAGEVGATPENTVGPMPVVSFDPHGTPSLLPPITALRWFIEYGGRYGTGWENWASLVTPKTPAPFNPGLCAPHLKTPILMMIAEDDEMPGCKSDVARAAFAAAPQPKELFEIAGGHFGLLHYPSALFDQASAVGSDFLLRRLG
jgi:pimeloyl-ACP methyl ester carboxylesterase